LTRLRNGVKDELLARYFLIIYLICEKNLLTTKIKYPDIKGMKPVDHLTSPVNKSLVPKII
jgi:hypothetical protein